MSLKNYFLKKQLQKFIQAVFYCKRKIQKKLIALKARWGKRKLKSENTFQTKRNHKK